LLGKWAILAGMNLLSFSSKVVYGYVGHSAAKLLLERFGHTVWAIDSVVFSNHPGYGRHAGRVTPADEIRALARGLEVLGLFGECGAVFSGYLGSAANAEAVAEIVPRVKDANPGAFFACDPVMGNRDTGLYVADDLPAAFAATVLPLADIALPNAFELELLTGVSIRDVESGLAAAEALRRLGPRTVVTTGVGTNDQVSTVAISEEGAWVVDTPRLTCRASGTGDAFAAIFLSHFCNGMPIEEALTRAVSGVYAVIEATGESVELAVIAAQDQAVQPSRSWSARRVR
jgi:pyridoxine kinase